MSGLANPENAEKGKGFLEGREVEVLDAGWAVYDGQGKWKYPSTCFFMELEASGLKEPTVQYWSIGKPEDFKPTKDGRGVVAKKKMSEQCNLFLLTASMINAGVNPEVVDTIDEDATVLKGFSFRMGVVIKNKDDKYGTPVVDEVLGGGQSDPGEAAIKVVTQILAENDESIELKALPKALPKYLIDYGEQAADIKKVIMGKGWLEANFTIAGSTLTA